MMVIGITGGVGAGKSEILNYLQKHYSCRILMADQAARELEKPGAPCYEPLLELLGRDAGLLDPSGVIRKEVMAARIFSDPDLLKKINELIHPAVRAYIIREIDKDRVEGHIDYFFLEAALLIEAGYTSMLDRLWYIYCSEEVRRERLKKSRGYSDEKIRKIMSSQLTEETFRKAADEVIDNSGEFSDACSRIDAILNNYEKDEY